MGDLLHRCTAWIYDTIEHLPAISPPMIYESDEGALAGTKTVIDVDVDDSKTPMSGFAHCTVGPVYFSVPRVEFHRDTAAATDTDMISFILSSCLKFKIIRA